MADEVTVHLESKTAADLEEVRQKIPLATRHAVASAALRVGLSIFINDATQAATEIVRARSAKRGGER